MNVTDRNVLALDSITKSVIICRKCPRLAAWREEMGRVKRKAYRDQEYWAKPVPGFGDPNARVMVVGLAPGAHGSNRTGRMFTGDASGDFLYPALYRKGFANQPNSFSITDGLELKDLWITAVCRCAPPDNKPTRQEVQTCLPYLISEYNSINTIIGIVALGSISYEHVCRVFRPEPASRLSKFGHGVFIDGQKDAPWILASYHPSRQNTQTGRLTVSMFDQIWDRVNSFLVK
jgi:uracil-DNA glycosylase